jgi:DNA-binding XRE family transcriptional regulator
MIFDDTERRPEYGAGLPRLRKLTRLGLPRLRKLTRLGQPRHEAGYTQQTLADHLGVSLRAVQNWESEKYLPRGKMLGDYADALGMTISEVIGEESRLNELDVRVSRIEAFLAGQDADREVFLRALRDAARRVDMPGDTPEEGSSGQLR